MVQPAGKISFYLNSWSVDEAINTYTKALYYLE